MIVKPKIREFICTTAHPKGIYQNIKNQIEYIKSKKGENRYKKENVLVIGCGTGYGLSCRIAAAFLKNSPTIGVIFEKPAKNNRTATAGWYNTAFFEEFAIENNIYAKTINEDAFEKQTIEKTAMLIKKDLKKIDMLIYSLAAPRRKMPDGTIVNSVLKPIGQSYENKTINLQTNEVYETKIPAATEDEIKNTIKVMGGENLKNWVEFLKQENLFEKNAKIISFSYEGPKITHAIYKEGTIGKAKQDLLDVTNEINNKFKDLKAYISLNKALVTQSSAAIPVVPLYISILYKIMKEENLHENCIEQMYRLFSEKLNNEVIVDEENKIRLDNFEMLPKIQEKVKYAWEKINTNNIENFADLQGYKQDFLNMFGFNLSKINYEEDINTNILINSLKNSLNF